MFLWFVSSVSVFIIEIYENCRKFALLDGMTNRRFTNNHLGASVKWYYYFRIFFKTFALAFCNPD